MELIHGYQKTNNIDYSEYDFEKFGYIPPLKPTLNANLYTGEPFKEGSGYKDFPVIPDATYMNNINLKSANPPPNATTQFVDTIRPGNNSQMFPGTRQFSDNHNIFCREKDIKHSLPKPCHHVDNFHYL